MDVTLTALDSYHLGHTCHSRHRHGHGRAELAPPRGSRRSQDRLAGRAGDAPRAADLGMRRAGRGRRDAASGLEEGRAMEV